MTALSLYKLIFMTELLVAEGLLTFRMSKRKYFWWRVLGAIAVCYLVAFLFPVLGNMSYSSWYSSFMFFFFFLVTMFALVFVYNITWGGALFCALSAYTVQHLAYGVVSILLQAIELFDFGDMYSSAWIDFSKFNAETLLAILCYLQIYAVVYIVSYFILAPKLKYNQDLKIRSVAVMCFMAVILVIDIILNAVIVYVSDSAIKDYILNVYNIMCCILVFYMQVELVNNRNMKMEVENMSEALKLAKNQYELRKENIQLINMKCHDLKHYIGQVATRKGLDSETIDEIQKMISVYDAPVETGMEVLDIILTEKSLICSNKEIALTCQVDCSGFKHISEGDLFVLFGNIIDNAIEAVVKLTDKEKRCIVLHARNVGKLISISLTNYYEGEIKFRPDGLPYTSKGDEDAHGFGMRSVAMIVEKYKGSMTISAKDQVFTLGIMIPLS